MEQLKNDHILALNMQLNEKNRARNVNKEVHNQEALQTTEQVKDNQYFEKVIKEKAKEQ